MHMHPRLVHAHELSAIIRVVGKSSLGYTGSHIYTHTYIYIYIQYQRSQFHHP
jgi:hypothetical protein